jgi:hypothetical protein
VFRDPSAAKLIQPVEDPWFEALQNHAIGVLDLPVRPGVCHGYPIHADMVIIIETEELLLENYVSLSLMMEFGTLKQ